MKRVFIYRRVSTKEQLDGSGLDRQQEACLNFCNSKGWPCLRVFTEQESGSVDSADRPKLSEAMDLCTPAIGVSTIVIERADRIARDLIVSELFFRECREKKIEVYAADSGEELVNAEADPTRVLIRQILGALAQWDKAQIAKKLLAGRKRKKLDTGWHCGGRPAFGWKPEEKPIVREILRLHRNGYSVRELCRRLNYYNSPEYQEFRKFRKWWAESSVHLVIKTWNHRAEFLDTDNTK
jgi:DNA invertase Pin-like site-specific DNA recombinase